MATAGQAKRPRDLLGLYPDPGPHRKSFVDFLNLVRGAHASNHHGTRYDHQKALEKHYGTGYVVKEAGKVEHWQPVTKAAMSVQSGLVGGYLLPQDYSDALLETVAEAGFIYPRATVLPMYSLETQAPRVNVETAPTSAGVSPFFGGVNFRWGLEDAPAASEPTFRMTNFTAWDLLGDAVVSNQWLQDAGAIQPTGESPRPEADPLLKAEHYLLRLFGKAAAWSAEWAFLNGPGAALRMPLGILHSPATRAVTRAGAGLISVADVANMAGTLLPYSWSNNSAIWAVSPTALVPVQQLSTYQVNVSPVEANKLSPRPCGFLNSLPLFVTDKLPPLGQRGDLVLFDPSLYVIGQRQEVVVDVSPDVLFQTNQTVYRIWARLDGKPEFSNSITLLDTTTVVSPYVVLDA